MVRKALGKHRYDSILFDIDNVLIDTRMSYLEAIRWTVEIYLTTGTVPFIQPSKSNVPQILKASDISAFKLLGGFNDDWDCSYGLLVYLLSLPIEKRTIPELRKLINLSEFSKKVKERPLRVSGIVSMLGNKQNIRIEKIADIFQEIYLGKKILQRTGQKKFRYWKKSGLIEQEKLIFKRSILQNLKAKGLKLGIATGRPRFEAVYCLRKFKVLDLFDAMTTIDEVKMAEQMAKKSLRKPHPYSILETAKKIGEDSRFIYIGDLPDDILAAQAAKSDIEIDSAAFPAYSFEKKADLEIFKTIKPDHILNKPEDLLKIIHSN